MRLAWLAGPVLFTLVAGPARGEEWSRQYAVKGKPELHVKTDDGQVRIETGTGSQIDARVRTEGWRIGPGEVTIRDSQTGDRVDLEVKIPNRHFSVGHRSIEVTVRVPKQADLDVRTGDGAIVVQPLSGNVSLSTGDGSITADGLQGEIRLQTGDGSITATGLHGNIRIHTGDGSIRGTGLSGRLAAHTGDGSIDVRGRFDGLDLNTGDGAIDAAVEAGSKIEGPWSLHTGDGGVTLRLPEGLGAELDAHTGDGGISFDKPVSVRGTIKENTVRGTLGPGGPPLKVETGSGAIRLTGL